MPSNQIEALLQCGCGCGTCTGCCFCNQFPATNVNYVIDAPGCAELDGLFGNISGPDTGIPTGCGSCVGLPNNLQDHLVPTYVWDDSDPENCIPQLGATFQFRFLLNCNLDHPESETNPLTTEACCRNVRLQVVEAATDEVRLDIAPSSCSCDPVTGMMAVFPLEKLYPDCTTFYTAGVCAGKPTCALLGDGPGGDCTMAGATLTITQSC